MNDRLHPNMFDTTRFRQAGRLSEVATFLQRLLGGEPPVEAAAVTTGQAPSESAPHLINTGAETITMTHHQPTGAAGRTIGATAGITLPPLPEALRSFLERLDSNGFASGLGGLTMPTPGAALEPVPDGAAFLAGSYSNHAGSRAYKLYVPSGAHGQTLPLVVMLHGCTQSPDDFAAGTRMNALAEEHTCLVAYPAQTSSANPSRCWNWFSPGDQQREQGEPSLIAGITRQIMRDYPVDPQRVYVAGLSAGGAAAAIMGSTYPDLYAAIGVHSGLAVGSARDMPSAFAAMQGGAVAQAPAGKAVAGAQRTVPTIVFHGDQDTTVNPRNGDQVIAQARGTSTTALQATATVQQGHVPGGRAYRRTFHADAQGAAVLEQWVVHGAGHAWSGGSHAGSYTDPQGPDATREMLRFFLAHPHPTTGQAVH
jgi:poly(hydroxyalkanoate) depolymerase family esterase